MVQYWFNNPKVLVLLTVTLVLLVAVACGTTAPAAPQSPPTEAAPSSASGGGGASQPVVADTPTPTPEPAQPPASDIVAEARGVLRIGNKDLGPPQFLPKNMAVPQCTYITPVTFDALWSVTPMESKNPA